MSARVEPAPVANDALIGALFILVSGFGFGSVTVLARVAFESGSNAPTSLALRFGLAAGIIWLLLLARRQMRRLPAPRIIAFALAALLLSERLTPQQILGGAVIVSSTIALQVVPRLWHVRCIPLTRARSSRMEEPTMSRSDRNIRKPASDGLNKDELAAERADDDPVQDFSLFGGDLAEAAAEASAANLLAPEEEEPVPVQGKKKRQTGNA